MRNKSLSSIAFAIPLLFGCAINPLSSQQYPEVYMYPSDAKKVFDLRQEDEWGGEYRAVLANGEKMVVVRNESGRLSTNGKPVPSSGGYAMSLYTADINRDGYPEICLGSTFGSGYINECVDVYDYHNGKTLGSFSDRFGHDYFLGFEEKGRLAVFEYPPMAKEPLLRVGKLAVDGKGEFTVVWEETGQTSSESSVSSSAGSGSESSVAYSIPDGDVELLCKPILYENGETKPCPKVGKEGGDLYSANTFSAFALDVYANGELVPGEMVSFDPCEYCSPYYPLDAGCDLVLYCFDKEGVASLSFHADICVKESGEGYERYVMKRFDGSVEILVDDSLSVWDGYKATVREAYSWAKDLREVDGIRYETGYYGVAPGSFRNILYSEAEEDIGEATKLLDAVLMEVYPSRSQIDGGGYCECSYLVGSNAYSLKISNGFLKHDGKTYRVENFKGLSLSESASERLGFVTYSPIVSAKPTSGDEQVFSIEYLGKIEFEPAPDGVEFPAVDPEYYIDDFGDPIYIYAPSWFAYRGTMYRILSEDNFGSLFQ